MSNRHKRPSTDRRSPLYTSKAVAAVKLATVKRLGKDSDGAFRVRNREDKQV